MSQDVLHFQCSTCQAALTVPIQLAGVTGPCPKCGATVTSPAAPPPQVPVQMQVPVPPMPAMVPAGGEMPLQTPGSAPPPSPLPPLFPPQSAVPQPPMMVPVAHVPPHAASPPQPPFPQPMAGGWGMLEAQPPLAVPPPLEPVSVPSQLEQLLQPQAPQSSPSQPTPASMAGVAASVQNDPLLQSGSLLPPRRLDGQLPASGSLMHGAGLGGFGPGAGGLSAPSPSPQWNLPGADATPSPMPKSVTEDPMATILRGTNPPPSPLSPPQQTGSELDDEPKRPHAQPAAHAFPQQATAPAPVTMPQQTMNIRLGGAKRGKGKLIGALAALLVLGALGAGAWHFKGPLTEIAQRYMKSKAGDDSANNAGEPPSPATSDVSPPENASAESTNPPASVPGGAFDPSASQPEPGGAMKLSPSLAGDGKPTSPIVIGNANPNPSPVPASTPAPTAPGQSDTTNPVLAKGSAILGSSASRTPPTEIKPAGAPDGGPAVSSMSSVPKATLAIEPPAGAGTPGNPLLPPPLVGAMPKGIAPEPAGDLKGAQPQALMPGIPGSDDAATVQTSPEGKKAAQDLQAFFAAKNLEERIALTLGGESMKSQMQRYYEKTKKDPGPIPVDEIRLLRFDPKPQTGGGPHCVFTVASKQWEYPIPVMLQEEGGKFKVDWLTFVEFRDDLLREYLSEFIDVPAKFHVGISRSHYFEDDVPDLDGKDCFKIEPPLPTYVGYVFTPKGTPLAADLAKRITWEALTAFVVVELRWKQQGGMKWVELTAVPQLNWYSVPVEPKAASGEASEKKSGAFNVQRPKSKTK